MLVWRISAKQYRKFDGLGARAAGGRWNSPGYSVVYTSATVSLAALELLVHLRRDRTVKDLILISAEIPNDIEINRVDLSNLPPDWRESPPPVGLQKIGDEWVINGLSAVLAVPSAVIPQEDNYLLNPAHSDFKRIRISRPVTFSLDPRMSGP